MDKIALLKGYDAYGYEVMRLDFPSAEEASQLAMEVSKIGLSSEEAAHNIACVNDLLYQNNIHANDISTLNSRISATEAVMSVDVSSLKDELEAMHRQIAELKISLNELRSMASAKTEKPKQKSDLEIFTQIEWDEDFLKLSDGNFLLD